VTAVRRPPAQKDAPPGKPRQASLMVRRNTAKNVLDGIATASAPTLHTKYLNGVVLNLKRTKEGMRADITIHPFRDGVILIINDVSELNQTRTELQKHKEVRPLNPTQLTGRMPIEAEGPNRRAWSV
jgi:hypothetical protein